MDLATFALLIRELSAVGDSKTFKSFWQEKMTNDFVARRAKLVEQMRQEIRDEKVLRAMIRVPRELFIPLAYREMAYEDRPLSIDLGQTISQPLIVAMMTEALELKGTEKVLEIGTGSGYQAAILAELAKRVITVERHKTLVDKAKQIIEKLGYSNVEVYLAEESLGWKREAPYDAIIVTAGAPKVPLELLSQLINKGRLVIPVGSRYEQELLKITKKNHEVITVDLGPCRFVPLIGKAAWEEEN